MLDVQEAGDLRVSLEMVQRKTLLLTIGHLDFRPLAWYASCPDMFFRSEPVAHALYPGGLPGTCGWACRWLFVPYDCVIGGDTG